MNEAQRLKLISRVRVVSPRLAIRLAEIVAGRRNQEPEKRGQTSYPYLQEHIQQFDGSHQSRSHGEARLKVAYDLLTIT
jgi:hypothetical protein